MAQISTPHFHNQLGLLSLEVKVKEFMCIGALPPLDHPHIFIDMGTKNEAICPYCSTLYKYNPNIQNLIQPLECLLQEGLGTVQV